MIVDKPGDSAISKRKLNTGEMMMFITKKNLLIINIILLIFLLGGVFDIEAVEKKHILIIDPAHGGSEQGVKLNDDISEKDVTLAVALSLKKELAQEKNIEIVLTRDSDKKMDMEARREVIAKMKPDFVLSLHVNGGFGKNAAGFEIYYPEYLEEKSLEKGPSKDDKAKPQNKCQSDSLKMAKIVQENFNSLFPRKGRGLRKAGLPISDGILVPALSVEMGFATHAEDKKKLLASTTQTDIAKSLAKSIKTFFR